MDDHLGFREITGSAMERARAEEAFRLGVASRAGHRNMSIDITVKASVWRVRVTLGILWALFAIFKIATIPLLLGRGSKKRRGYVSVPIYCSTGWPRASEGEGGR